MYKRKGIQVHFKGSNTFRTALGNPKDKDPKANQTGIIYHYHCPRINCTSSYIGESGRTLGDRIKEHFKAPSPIHLHSSTTGHPMDPNLFSIVHKEVKSHPRTIKEAMFIWVQDPPYWFPPPFPPLPPTWWGAQFFFPMVSTHVYPKFPPLLIYKKSCISTIIISSSIFIC